MQRFGRYSDIYEMVVLEVKNNEIMKKASRYWASLNSEVREAWNRRAAFLNSRRIPGKFVSVPANIGGSLLDANVMEALTIEWEKVVNFLRAALVNPQRIMKNTTKKSSRTICFGCERFEVGNVGGFYFLIPSFGTVMSPHGMQYCIPCWTLFNC